MNFFSENADKRRSEVFFLIYSIFWMVLFFFVINLKWMKNWNDLTYNIFAFSVTIPVWIIPMILFREKNGFKVSFNNFSFHFNSFIAVFAFVQSYWGTQYFYNSLGMNYGFPKGIIFNGVPIFLYPLAHLYILSYCVWMIIAWRMVRTTFKISNPFFVHITGIIIACIMAFLETLIMASPYMEGYYWFNDWKFALFNGSIMYGGMLYITIVFLYPIDEVPKVKSSMRNVLVRALASNMLILLWLASYKELSAVLH